MTPWPTGNRALWKERDRIESTAASFEAKIHSAHFLRSTKARTSLPKMRRSSTFTCKCYLRMLECMSNRRVCRNKRRSSSRKRFGRSYGFGDDHADATVSPIDETCLLCVVSHRSLLLQSSQSTGYLGWLVANRRGSVKSPRTTEAS